MRKLSMIGVMGMFLVVGCGNNVPTEGNWPAGTWPARIVNISGFSSQQQSQVIQAVKYLNQQAGVTLVNTSDTGSGYPIYIQYVDNWPNAAERAGLATVSWQQCQIQLRGLLFNVDSQDEIPAEIHEIGHCSGIQQHDPNPAAVMNAMVRALDLYDENDIMSFVQRVGRSVGLL